MLLSISCSYRILLPYQVLKSIPSLFYSPGTFGNERRHFWVVTVLGSGSWCCWYLVGRGQGCGKHPTVCRRVPHSSDRALSVNSAAVKKTCSRGACSDYPCVTTEEEWEARCNVVHWCSPESSSVQQFSSTSELPFSYPTLEEAFWLRWETPLGNSVPLHLPHQLGEKFGGGWVYTKARFRSVIL